MINLGKTKIKIFPLKFTPPFFKKRVKFLIYLKKKVGWGVRTMILYITLEKFINLHRFREFRYFLRVVEKYVQWFFDTKLFHSSNFLNVKMNHEVLFGDMTKF